MKWKTLNNEIITREETIKANGGTQISYSYNDVKHRDDGYTETTRIGLSLLEVFTMTLNANKKKISTELKIIIDDLIDNMQTLNLNKSILEYAIGQEHIPAVEYMLSKGLDPHEHSTYTHYIFDSIVTRPATDNRLRLLDIILTHFTDIIDISQYEFNTNLIKYIDIMIKHNNFNIDSITVNYDSLTKVQKKKLVSISRDFLKYALEKQDYSLFPDDINKLFFV